MGWLVSEEEHQYNRRTEIKILELGESQEGVVPIASVESEGEAFAAKTSFEDSQESSLDKGGRATESLVNSDNNNSSVEEEMIKDEYYKEGTYAVIAGTFANHSYAVRRVSALMEKGYLEANIVKQERNGLYAVFVQTYDTRNQAFSLVKKLDRDQVHSYVLKR